jgi:glycosyltransferase involved in cell wall biosynthesis
MPARNAEAFVAEAAQSVLRQTHNDLELVVVNDGSTDGTERVLRELGDERIRIVPGPRRGISAAMNAGIEAARGRYFARCDADDLFPPSRLERQVIFLQDRPDFVAVCGRFETINPAGKRVVALNNGSTPAEITDELCSGQARTHLGTYLVRMDAVRRVGGFRAWFVTGEDVDFQFRVGEAGRVGYEPHVVYSYRLHDASITHRQASARQAFFEDCAREFQRQRRAGRVDDLDAGRPPQPPVDDRTVNSSTEHMWGLLIGQSWRDWNGGQRKVALWNGMRACALRPARWASWRNLGTLAVKRRVAGTS